MTRRTATPMAHPAPTRITPSLINTKDAIVSPEVLAQVFEDGHLPFPVNPDGSVDMPIYLVWLAEAGYAALQTFDEYSEEE
jgi:hypothetical protein